MRLAKVLKRRKTWGNGKRICYPCDLAGVGLVVGKRSNIHSIKVFWLGVQAQLFHFVQEEQCSLGEGLDTCKMKGRKGGIHDEKLEEQWMKKANLNRMDHTFWNGLSDWAFVLVLIEANLLNKVDISFQVI